MGSVYAHPTGRVLLHRPHLLAVVQLDFRCLLNKSYTFGLGFQIRMIISAAKDSAAKAEDEVKKSVSTIAKSMYHASLLRHQTLVCLRE